VEQVLVTASSASNFLEGGNRVLTHRLKVPFLGEAIGKPLCELDCSPTPLLQM
jgi:hypothetical protein